METNKETVAGYKGVTHAERSGLLGESARHNPESGASQLSGRVSRSKAREEQDQPSGRSKKPLALRIFLWLLIKSIVPILFVIILIVGLYVGFVVIGNKPSSDVFQWATWKHMYDLVFAE